MKQIERKLSQVPSLEKNQKQTPKKLKKKKSRKMINRPKKKKKKNTLAKKKEKRKRFQVYCWQGGKSQSESTSREHFWTAFRVVSLFSTQFGPVTNQLLFGTHNTLFVFFRFGELFPFLRFFFFSAKSPQNRNPSLFSSVHASLEKNYLLYPLLLQT